MGLVFLTEASDAELRDEVRRRGLAVAADVAEMTTSAIFTELAKRGVATVLAMMAMGKDEHSRLALWWDGLPHACLGVADHAHASLLGRVMGAEPPGPLEPDEDDGTCEQRRPDAGSDDQTPPG